MAEKRDQLARGEQQFTSRVGFLMAALGARITERQSQRLAQVGLTPKQHGILTLLRSRGPQAQQELSTTMGAAASSVVTLVDSLEQAGLVVRRDDPADRRRNRVEITTAGRRAARRADAIADQVEATLLAALSPAEQAALRATLTLLLAASEQQG